LDPQPLHEDPRPKSGKSRRLNLSGTILEEKSVGSDQREIKLKSRAHDLKNQDASYGQTQGFNLLQMSPN
jgi:hypothetical protein